MMASRSAFAVLLIILVWGRALVEATGRPFDSSAKTSSLNNLDDTEAIDDESLIPFSTAEDASEDLLPIPATEEVDEDLPSIPTTQGVDEETATIPMLEDIMDEDLVTTTPASEDGDLVTIPALEDTDGEQVVIPKFLRDYVSRLDPERIHQYEEALESNNPSDGDGIAEDEVGEMYESLGDEGQSVTFDEKDIQKEREIVFPEPPKESLYPSSLFLPPSLVKKIPFSSEKIVELIDKLHISHKSKLATIMSHVIYRCELTKEKYSKETILTKEKEKKKKKKKKESKIVKEEKIVKDIEKKEFSGEFGKVFKEKEIKVKKGKSIGDIEIKDKEVKKKETKWEKDEEKDNKYKKFLKKKVEKKQEKKKEIKEIEEKKRLQKEKELRNKEYKATKAKEKKFKESKEKEFKTFELEGKKERVSKENELKKKLFVKEGKFKEEEKYKYKEYKVKEIKGKKVEKKGLKGKKKVIEGKEFKVKEVEKKGLKGKKDKETVLEGKEFKVKGFKEKEVEKKELKVKKDKGKVIKGKEFKVKKPKVTEFEGKKYKLKKEKVYKDKGTVVKKKVLSKETLKCVESLEEMTKFVKKNLPAAKYIKPLETTSFTKHGDFKKIQWKVTEVKKHEKAVVCKKELFPFAVFKCKIVDKSKGVRLYYIKLKGKDGVRRKEIVACVDEKKSLTPRLGKAKTKALCRWITKSLVWVPGV